VLERSGGSLVSWGRSTPLALAIAAVAAIYALLMFGAENSEPAPPAEKSIEAPHGAPSPDGEVEE